MEIKFGPSGRLVIANTMNPIFRPPRGQLVGPFADLSLTYPDDAVAWPEPEGDFSCTSSF